MKRWVLAIALFCSNYAWAEDEEKVTQVKLTLSSLEEVKEKFLWVHKVKEGFYITDISMSKIYDDFFNSLTSEHYKKTEYDVELKPVIEGFCTNSSFTKMQKVSLTKMKVLEASPIEPDETFTYMSFELPESDLASCDLFFLEGKYDKALFSFPIKQSSDYFTKEESIRIDDVSIEGNQLIQDYIKKAEKEAVIKEVVLGDKKLKIIRHPSVEGISRTREKKFDIPYSLYLDDKKMLELKNAYYVSENRLYESGWTQVINILDINADGVLDFVLYEDQSESAGDYYFYISQKDGTYIAIRIPPIRYC